MNKFASKQGSVVTIADNKMSIKLSKAEWQRIGLQAGWLPKTAQMNAAKYEGWFAVMKKVQTGPRSHDYKPVDVKQTQEEANAIAGSMPGSRVIKVTDPALIADWVRKQPKEEDSREEPAFVHDGHLDDEPYDPEAFGNERELPLVSRRQQTTVTKVNPNEKNWNITPEKKAPRWQRPGTGSMY
jgi:hypothetical protein